MPLLFPLVRGSARACRDVVFSEDWQGRSSESGQDSHMHADEFHRIIFL